MTCTIGEEYDDEPRSTLKPAHIYEGHLEYSSLMPNPERWVKAADYEALQAGLREALDYIELDNEYPQWMGRLRALAGKAP